MATSQDQEHSQRLSRDLAERNDEAYRDWVHHDFSSRKLSEVMNAHGPALATLLGTCRESSDPKVQRALARFELLETQRALLAGEKP